MFDREIKAEFITHAASILAETQSGFSGPQIIKITTKYAVEYDMSLRNKSYPFGTKNKKTALAENLNAFDDKQLYEIIKNMCMELNSDDSNELLLLLIRRYGHLDETNSADGISKESIERTRHWLEDYPEVLEIFDVAEEKYSHNIYKRNLLDDLRLSLEILLKNLLKNEKSLENQLSLLSEFMKEKGGSKELSNMFQKLIDYYAKYQNTYVKHGDNVNDEEIEFIFEITASFTRHLIRLNGK